MARIDNLTNFLNDVSTAIKTKKGDDTPIPASNFDIEIGNLSSGGTQKPLLLGATYSYDGKTATTHTITNNNIRTNNFGYYKKTPDLVLVIAFIRTDYELSSNLSLVAETEWNLNTSNSTKQKIIVAKADMTSTEGYTITMASALQAQIMYIKFYDAGEPEVILNEIDTTGTIQSKEIAVEDDNMNLYIGSIMMMYTSSPLSATGMTYSYRDDRLCLCTTDTPTNLIFRFNTSGRSVDPYYQLIGLRIPYKKEEE